MKKFIRIGVDLAKKYFQIHALVSEGGPALTRKLTRLKMRDFFSQIEPCLGGMEAYGSAHYWARELKAMGHEVLLMPPAYTKPYVKRGKTDAVDADACCEAMSRPGMRFVPIKSAEQQATLMLHKTRELLVKQRTMSVTRFLTENQWPGKIHLILSVKNRGEYLFQEEIAALCGRNDRLNVVVAMTDPKEAMWPGPKGRIDKALLASIVPDIAARRIHLCGPAAMMEAVTVALVDLGAPPERIQKEAFVTCRVGGGAH
jgi:hypothetical protein